MDANIKKMEKYVKYEIPSSEKKIWPWNMMTFYDCKVLSIDTVKYEKAGKRMSIEIEAPKLRKKYYLYAWSDEGICEAIEKSGLKVGDYISCHAELSYYQNKEGRHCEAYKIMADSAFLTDEKLKETPRFFKLMRIRRDTKKEPERTPSGHLTKNQMLKMMLG